MYREALKQAAVDPSTGKIDITILTTGLSGAARKRKAEITQALKKIIQGKGKVSTLKHQKLYEEFRENSDFVSLVVLKNPNFYSIAVCQFTFVFEVFYRKIKGMSSIHMQVMSL